MTRLKFHWFLPTNGGDGRQVVGGGHGVGPAPPAGRPRCAYLGQIARSAEQLGFEAALTPTGAWCEDAWVSTAMLSQVSERLKFLVAFRPGLTVAVPRRADGRHVPEPLRRPAAAQRRHRRREPRAADVRRLPRQGRPLRALRRVPRDRPARCGAARPSTSRASTCRVEDAVLTQLPDPLPEIYFGGSSPAAGEVAAKHADVYLTWGEPPEAVAREGRVDPQAGRRRGPRGPALRHPAAHHRPRHLRGGLGRGRPAAGRHLARRRSRGAGRAASRASPWASAGCSTLNGGSKDGLEIHPNLWAGVGLVRGGAGTAMVGSHAEIADLVEQYAAVGIEEFVLSGYPHLEECLLVRRGRAARAGPARPVGAPGAAGGARRRRCRSAPQAAP